MGDVTDSKTETAARLGIKVINADGLTDAAKKVTFVPLLHRKNREKVSVLEQERSQVQRGQCIRAHLRFSRGLT